MKKKNGLIFGAAALVVLCAVYVGVGQYMDRSQKKTENQKEASKVYMTDFSEFSQFLMTGMAMRSPLQKRTENGSMIRMRNFR